MTESAITKDQWAAIEEKLKGLLATVKFQRQGHDVTVQKTRLSENRLGLVVFIDGVCRGAWLDGTDETYGPLVQQLWRKRTRSIYKPSVKARIEKQFGKRRAREIFSELDDVVEAYDPTFNTAASLVRQFRKIDGLTLMASIDGTEQTDKRERAHG